MVTIEDIIQEGGRREVREDMSDTSLESLPKSSYDFAVMDVHI